MGVPVVTLEGDAHVSRVGISLLNTVGLHGLITKTENEYRVLAVGLANDSTLLQTLRNNLRQRLLDSPLTDNITFTRNLEQLYRQIWHRWCHREGS
jgi:predicted O-linked N-acetylglucosamine transferase (SPINDLY family)